MVSATCTITSKGQVTIPKRIRKQLGVELGDKVTFIVNESGTVEVRPMMYTIEDLRGIVPTPSDLEGKSFEEVFNAAYQERVGKLTGKRSR